MDAIARFMHGPDSLWSMSQTMYATQNFRTKKALKDAVEAGQDVRIMAHITIGFTPPPTNGTAFLEGPWHPQPHRWYAEVTVRNGRIVEVK